MSFTVKSNDNCYDSSSEDTDCTKDKKYVHEVGADMIGNQLIIRMEKDKNKKRKGWDPPCDCDVIEIKRPTRDKGPEIVNGGDNNQIVFRIHSKANLQKKSDRNYKPQAIAYKVDFKYLYNVSKS